MPKEHATIFIVCRSAALSISANQGDLEVTLTNVAVFSLSFDREN